MKTRNIVFGAMLMVLLMAVPFAIAEETTDTVDSNTVEETKLMTTPAGAEVRLLQLEKSITRNVLVGAAVIEVIQTNHPEEDLTGAQSTLDGLESVLEEVKATDLEQDKNALVTAFVAAKKEAIDLAKEFREQTSAMLTAEDRQMVSEVIKDMNMNELNEIGEKVRNKIRESNAERVGDLLDEAGMSNPELVNKIKNGEATQAQIKEAVMEAYGDLNAEQKKNAAAKIKERTIKRTVEEKELAKQARETGLQRALQNQANRLERVSEWMEQKGIDANANGYDARARRLVRASEQLQNMSDRIEQIVQRRQAGQTDQNGQQTQPDQAAQNGMGN